MKTFKAPAGAAYWIRPRPRRGEKMLPFIIFLITVLVTSRPAAAQPPADSRQHDMILMLPRGPVHLRLDITAGGKGLRQMREDYLDTLIASLDTDADGKLSRGETDKHPLFNNGRRFEGNAFLQSLRSNQRYSDRDVAMTVDRAAGQLIAYRQDNQLADQDLRVFNVLDADGSGLIEPAEMRLAASRIADRDGDFDQCVTFDEFTLEETMSNSLTVNTALPEPPGAVHSEWLRSAAEPILPARLVRRYDVDQNARLSATELSWDPARVAALDDDGDGELTMQELGAISRGSDPDLSLSVDLNQPAADAMKPVGMPPGDAVIARSDLIRMKCSGALLDIGYRYRDPVAEATTNAQATFNAIDSDGNGYMDRDEIAEHQRFERYLFDAMDADEDDRVFAEEMMRYVREYTRPASTSCQITLLDTGNGFFQMLDQSGDGRISIRELRACEKTLQSVSDDPAINPSRMTTSYRIEIQRGGASLFGRVDRPAAQTPTALVKPPTGPIWFQRMDRNRDGDLTWDEFLGPREVFHQIDLDHDDLIDEAEATQLSPSPKKKSS